MLENDCQKTSILGDFRSVLPPKIDSKSDAKATPFFDAMDLARKRTRINPHRSFATSFLAKHMIRSGWSATRRPNHLLSSSTSKGLPHLWFENCRCSMMCGTKYYCSCWRVSTRTWHWFVTKQCFATLCPIQDVRMQYGTFSSFE